MEKGKRCGKSVSFWDQKYIYKRRYRIRKGITIGVYMKLENIFKNRKIENNIKLKVYEHICRHSEYGP